jgi:hypothetical protein
MLPWVWRTPARRAVLFSLVFLAVAWFQMAITVGAGGSVHHSILLWPFPLLIIAAVFGEMSRRMPRKGLAALAVVTAFLGITNLLVTNRQYVEIIRNGGANNWTDAVFPLSAVLKKIPAEYVMAIDWGIIDPVRLIDQGAIPVRVGSDPVSKPEMTPADREQLLKVISMSNVIFVGHTPGSEFFEGANARHEAGARSLGFRRETLAVVADRHGRERFEVFRYWPCAGACK